MQLSIVVSVYNKEDYLDECVESILRQTKRDIEVILVDDGSEDTSGELCDKWGKIDKRVRVYHQSNIGGMLSRKRGIDYSTSKYITFVDADDFVNTKSFSMAERYMDKGIDVICFGMISYRSGHSITEREVFAPRIYYKDEIENDILPKLLFSEGGKALNASLCNKVFKKELLLKTTRHLPTERITIADDVIIVYPAVYCAETIAVSEDAYYCYRKRNITDVAPYYNDGSYFDQLYAVYAYLRGCFENEPILMKQNEQLYMQLVMERQRKYEFVLDDYRFIFPFDKVNKNERIILYGAGRVGMEYYSQVKKLNYCTIVKWIDKNYMKYSQHGGLEISSPDTIKDTSFDKVVLAAKNEELRCEMRSGLKSTGIESGKIVSSVV